MRTEQKHQAGAILALDTSTASMAAAIVSGHDVLAEIQTLAERNHSVHVVTHIKEMLLSSGVTAADIDAIAVGNGPGSYTGMRIAVSVAQDAGMGVEQAAGRRIQPGGACLRCLASSFRHGRRRRRNLLKAGTGCCRLWMLDAGKFTRPASR